MVQLLDVQNGQVGNVLGSWAVFPVVLPPQTIGKMNTKAAAMAIDVVIVIAIATNNN